MNNDHMKMVRFDIYCKRCKRWYKKESSDKCNECLAHPMNHESAKPIYFEEAPRDKRRIPNKKR